jgi:hypothetical protein
MGTHQLTSFVALSCSLLFAVTGCVKVLGIGEADVDPAFSESSEVEGDCKTAPKTHVDFLNACTSSQCVPFDDRARLAHLKSDGSLPSLPPAPADSSSK